MYKYKPGKRRRVLKGYVLPDEKAERRRQRLRWRRTLIVLAMLAAVAGAVFLYRSPLLRVQEVQVVNATSTSPERIAELADLEGASMFNTPLDEAEARIVALPLVKGVQAQRRWPNKVRIEVIERTPWGYWDLAGTSYVIDGEGVILANVQPPNDAPVIHDIGDPATLSAGDRVDADAVRLAQALLSLVPDQLTLRITQFEYTLEKGLSVVTDANYRVVMGDSQNVDYKLAVWKTVEEDIGREAMAGHVLDLRFRDRPSFQ